MLMLDKHWNRNWEKKKKRFQESKNVREINYHVSERSELCVLSEKILRKTCKTTPHLVYRKNVS